MNFLVRMVHTFSAITALMGKNEQAAMVWRARQRRKQKRGRVRCNIALVLTKGCQRSAASSTLTWTPPPPPSLPAISPKARLPRSTSPHSHSHSHSAAPRLPITYTPMCSSHCSQGRCIPHSNLPSLTDPPPRRAKL